MDARGARRQPLNRQRSVTWNERPSLGWFPEVDPHLTSYVISRTVVVEKGRSAGRADDQGTTGHVFHIGGRGHATIARGRDHGAGP